MSDQTPPHADEPTSSPSPTDDERTMGMLCHLLALAGYLIPLGNIVGPLIIWLSKKDQSTFVDDQGKESLNFQITVTLAILASIPLWFVCIGMFITPLIGVAALIMLILAAIAANQGQRYRYPVSWRVIK